LVLSAVSGQEINQMDLNLIPNIDKYAHFIMYFVFSFLLLYDFTKGKGLPFSLRKRIAFTLCLAVFYGGVMELIQLIPWLHRSTDWTDFLTNSLGAVTAVTLYTVGAKLLCKSTNYTTN